MGQKRPASNPPPGPGQSSSRLRMPETTITATTNKASNAAGSYSVVGGSSEKVAAPTAGLSDSVNTVGSSPKTLSTTGNLAGSSTKAPVSAGPSRVARSVSGGTVSSLNESDSSVDLDEDGEDGVNWEDVDLGPQAITNLLSSTSNNTASASLSLTLSGKGKEPARTVRVVTAVERRVRWESHKMHLLCLLHHVSLRNRWCGSSEVQGNLSPLVGSGIRRLLTGYSKEQPHRRSLFFKGGLTALSEMWVRNFRVMRAGLSKCRWAGPENFIHKGGDPPLGYKEFVIVSQVRKGSRDIGAQLFCAMLRSVGVTCRLVCSLQVLPFTFSSNEPPMKIPTGATAGSVKGIGYINKTWLRNCRQNDYGNRQDERGWPVYWVEAWSTGAERWIAVDPFATKTVGMPSAIEPPAQIPGNSMSYVVGFEEDGDCTDVTRRYAQAFLSKTCKVRVTGTPAGEIWWDKVMAMLATGAHPDRQRLEQAQLADKVLHEPIPKTIKDLKGHPLYVLERDLKRDESLKVLRPCGTLTAGVGKNKKIERIYRRKDVIKLRSLENWAHLGRTVKPEEESKPIKCVKAVRLPSTKLRNARSGNVESEMSGLYAESQTELYVPQPLVNGRLVKNKYGSIDLYVESMLPEGAIHLPQKNIGKAARLVGVDFAPAITNFEYRNGSAYPIATGIVVAKDYAEAIEAVHEGLVEAQDEKAARDCDMKALRLWRRFITKIRILEHVSRIPEEQESTHHPMTMMARTQGKAVEKGVLEVVEADEEGFGGFCGGFYSASEGSEPPTTRKRIKKPQSLKRRYEELCSPRKTFAAKTAARKRAKSKPSARKPRGRKVVAKSDEEEEEAEESEASYSNSSRNLRRSLRPRNYTPNYKSSYESNSNADSSDYYDSDNAATRQQKNKVTPRRSTRIASGKATPVKYTLDEDDDEYDDEYGLEPELEKQQQGEGEEAQNQKERTSGGSLIESDGSCSELSDPPSDLLSEAEYEALVGGKATGSDLTLEEGGRGFSGFTERLAKQDDDRGDDGKGKDKEGDGAGDVEPRGAVGVFEMPHGSGNGGDLDETNYVLPDARPIAEDGTANTAETDQEMVDCDNNGDDHNDHNIAAGESLPVGNGVEEADEAAVGATTALPDTMAGLEEIHYKEQTPGRGSGPTI